MVSRRNQPVSNKGVFNKMKASKNGIRPSYIPPYSRRKDFCKKIRQIEKQIKNLKATDSWIKASYLEWYLRNVWWGYKRYVYD